jgi:hypothetical protein
MQRETLRVTVVDSKPLEAALVSAEQEIARMRPMAAALDGATPQEARALAMQIEGAEERLNDADNALGDALETFAEKVAEERIRQARELLTPLLADAAALSKAGADGRKLRELLDLADLLDLEPMPDAAALSQIVERVNRVQSKIDGELRR